MDLRSTYEKMKGDYDSVLIRLRDDAKIIRFLVKFTDYDWMLSIKQALEEEDYEKAFREVHNLKGVCANLSLDELGKSAGALTEALRGGKPNIDITPLLDTVKADYDMTAEAINELK